MHAGLGLILVLGSEVPCPRVCAILLSGQEPISWLPSQGVLPSFLSTPWEGLLVTSQQAEPWFELDLRVGRREELKLNQAVGFGDRLGGGVILSSRTGGAVLKVSEVSESSSGNRPRAAARRVLVYCPVGGMATRINLLVLCNYTVLVGQFSFCLMAAGRKTVRCVLVAVSDCCPWRLRLGRGKTRRVMCAFMGFSYS